VLFILLLGNSLIRAATGYYLGFAGTAVLVFAFIILFPFAMLPLIRKATWRVRNRLFVTYCLVGILPILLIYLLVQLGSNLVLGQTTNYLLHKELERRLEQLLSSTERRAQAVADGKAANTLSVEPGEGVVVRVAETV